MKCPEPFISPPPKLRGISVPSLLIHNNFAPSFPPIHRQLSKRTDGISSSRRIEKPKWITCVCCSSIVFRNWRLRANTAHYLSAGPYYIDVLSSACIAELLLINSDDMGFREGHLSLSTAINVVPYSPLPEEKKKHATTHSLMADG